MKKLLALSILACTLAAYSCANEVDLKDMQRYQTCVFNNKTYQCLNSQHCCEGVCVTPSERNCSACKAMCGEYEACELANPDTAELTQRYIYECHCGKQGICSGTCCNDECKDTDHDSANCGACGKTCGKNMMCSSGECVPNCPTPTTACTTNNSIECVNFNNDPANCGECGVKCPDPSDANLNIKDSYCGNQKCEIVCEDGYINDNGLIKDGCETSIKKCNNGKLDPGEICDGGEFIEDVCAKVIGSGSKPVSASPSSLRCKADCSGLEDGSCTNVNVDISKCGNGFLDTGEICDYNHIDTNYKECSELLNAPAAIGTAPCTKECKYDDSKCVYCGDGKVNGDETCDGNAFKNGVSKCAEYDASKYVSGNLVCRSCQISTENCVEKCTEGKASCGSDAKSIDTCKNGTFVNTPCQNDKSLCLSGDTPQCVQCLKDADCVPPSTQTCQDNVCKPIASTKTYTDDFKWITESNQTTYDVEIGTKKYDDYIITVKARPELGGLNSGKCSINGKKGIVLRDASEIKISALKNGVGTVDVEYKLYDANTEVALVCNDDPEIAQKALGDKTKCEEASTSKLTFNVNSKSCTQFTLKPKKSGSNNRIVFYNLSWTSAQ